MASSRDVDGFVRRLENRVAQEVKGRPLYIVSESHGFGGEAAVEPDAHSRHTVVT